MVEEMRAMVVAPREQLAASSDYEGLQLVVSPAEAKKRLQELQAFVAAVMIQGQDFGVIPGTEKPSLLQPGAQKLEEVYGFAHEFVDAGSTQDWNKPFFNYRKRCVLRRRRDGMYIGDGIGSCNSLESRYAQRWVFDNEIPPGINKAALKKKEFRRKNNSGSFFKYSLPNEDIFSLVNTIEKMACKRALVAAVIGATRSSGIFTQDVEDLPREVFGEVDEQRSWDKPTPVEKSKEPPVDPPPATKEASPKATRQAEPKPTPPAAAPPKQQPKTEPVAFPTDEQPPPDAKAAIAAWEDELRAASSMREAGIRANTAVTSGIDKGIVTAVYNEVISALKAKRGAQ